MHQYEIKSQPPFPEMHSIAETEKVLGLSRSSIYKLIYSNQLRVTRILSKPYIVNVREFLQHKVEEARQCEARLAQ